MPLAPQTLCCFADMPGWGYYGPLAGSFLLAGIFLAIGITSGGVWLVSRLRSRPGAGARRWSLRALGGAALSAALFTVFIDIMFPCFWVPAAMWAAAGFMLLRESRSVRIPERASK